jgi:hypothetical protein
MAAAWKSVKKENAVEARINLMAMLKWYHACKEVTFSHGDRLSSLPADSRYSHYARFYKVIDIVKGFRAAGVEWSAAKEAISAAVDLARLLGEA